MSPKVSFEVLARLGSGGMGDVFLAVMRRGGTEQRVALKRLRAGAGPISERYPHFEREAHICSLLEHPNVVRLEAYGYDETGPYLALELVDGHSVSALLREYLRLSEPLPLDPALCIARDAAAGLAYAHGREVVHRDMSPDNVLVSYDGVAKVTDFGVAKVVGAESLTSTGIIVGKYGYLAPELFDGAKATVASDVFSFSATLYRLLTGVAAFPGRTEAELMRAVLSTEPVPMTQLRDVPGSVALWVQEGLQKDPAKRPASMASAVAMLDAQLTGSAPEQRAGVKACMEHAWPPGTDQRRTELSLPAVQPVTSTVTAKVTGQRRVVAVVAAGAVVGLGLGAWYASRPPPAPKPPFVEPRRADVEAALAKGVDAGVEEEPVADAGSVVKTTRPRRPVQKPGSLVVLSLPTVRVYVDDELKGSTPMRSGIELPAGRHVVRAVNEKLAIDKKYDVTVKPGAETTVRVVTP